MGLSHTKAGGTNPENMNLLVSEPTRRPGQPLCQDPWGQNSGRYLLGGSGHWHVYAPQERACDRPGYAQKTTVWRRKSRTSTPGTSSAPDGSLPRSDGPENQR